MAKTPMATLPTPGARTQLAKTVGTPTTLPQQGPPPGFTPSPAAPATAPARNIPTPSLTPGERAAIGATPRLGGQTVLTPPLPVSDAMLMANMRMPPGGQGVFPPPGARTQVAQAAGTPMGLPPTQAPPGYVSTPLTAAQQQQIAAQGATLTPSEIAARTEALMAQRQHAAGAEEAAYASQAAKHAEMRQQRWELMQMSGLPAEQAIGLSNQELQMAAQTAELRAMQMRYMQGLYGTE